MLDGPTPVSVPTMCCSPGRPPRMPPPGPPGKLPAGGAFGAWVAVGAPAGRPVALADLFECSMATTSAPRIRPATSQAPVDNQPAGPRRGGAAGASGPASGASRKSCVVESGMGPRFGAVAGVWLVGAWQVAVSGRKRQDDPEGRSASGGLDDIHPAPVRADESRDDRQPEPGAARVAAPGSLDPVEALEDPLADLGRQPRAVIDHLDDRPLALGPQSHLDRCVRRSVPKRVGEQVLRHLVQPGVVT